ncbi:hypothetical protein ACFSJY_14875 [Thalassotalea euphylliae]|uniref:hypothetical protein n=1 Tax=Thalassotalea euphylliae TaxID=1655234 RepID=UPI00362A92AC
MKVFVMGLLLLCGMAHGKSTNITIYSDSYNNNMISPQDLAGVLFEDVVKNVQDEFNVTFQNSSMKREWVALSQSDNVCLYNKRRTAEREQMGSFGKYPLLAFPPNRLITHADAQIPESVSLVATVDKWNLTIGIASGRSYGKRLDQAINKLPEHNVVMVEGSSASIRLREMMKTKRIDAFIEFWPTIVSVYPEEEARQLYNLHELIEATDFIFGHVVCSDSPLGDRFITRINEEMGKPSFFEKVLRGHRNEMPREEYARIREALRTAYLQ